MSAKSATKQTLNVALVVAIILITWVVAFRAEWVIGGIPKVSAAAAGASEKSDGECTNQADQPGRCGDKCPEANAEGVYYEQGIDREGKLACGFAYYHECPYASAVSADDPLCYKIQQEQQQTASAIAQTNAEVEANPAAFPGK